MFTKKWAGGNSIHLDLCGSFSGVHFPFSMWQLTPLAVANNYLFVDFEVIIECFIISNNQSVIATVTETRAGTSDNDSSTSLVVVVRVLTAAIFLFFVSALFPALGANREKDKHRRETALGWRTSFMGLGLLVFIWWKYNNQVMLGGRKKF